MPNPIKEMVNQKQKGNGMHPQIHIVQTSDQQTLCAKTWGDQQKPALVLVHGYPDNQEMHVSHETIYKTLFIQTQGH